MGLNQTILFHAGKVLRDLDLRFAENFLEMADAEWATGDKVEEAETGFVAEALVNPNQFHSH